MDRPIGSMTESIRSTGRTARSPALRNCSGYHKGNRERVEAEGTRGVAATVHRARAGRPGQLDREMRYVAVNHKWLEIHGLDGRIRPGTPITNPFPKSRRTGGNSTAADSKAKLYCRVSSACRDGRQSGTDEYADSAVASVDGQMGGIIISPRTITDADKRRRRAARARSRLRRRRELPGRAAIRSISTWELDKLGCDGRNLRNQQGVRTFH